MKDIALYQQILGIVAPWRVSAVNLDLPGGKVTVDVEHSQSCFRCPLCQAKASIHDHRMKVWRTLDSCQLETYIQARVPRIKCPEHGVVMVEVPWAERGSRFTAIFEAFVIMWLEAATLKDVAKRVGLSWDQVDGIQKRAVDRGLARRESRPIARMGVDETSFSKRHDYITAVVDTERNIVVDVLDGRKKATFKEWLEALPPSSINAIKTVSMDMYDGYINAVREVVPGAEDKICFDRFHVAQHFGKGVDKVRASEHRAFLSAHGQSVLTHTKHAWLRNSEKIDNRTRPFFMEITKMNLKTARAWAIKETASSIWDYIYVGVAEKAWKRLFGWTSRCRLKPMIKAGKTAQNHLWGILNAIQHKVSNAAVEGKNASIQRIKCRACGFRNKERFKRAILFHLGGLDLFPDGVSRYKFSHLKS
jgi:transposase